MIEVKRQSYLTGKFNVRMIDATSEQFRLYELGLSVEDSMPNVSASDATFIVSGITEEEWYKELKNVKETI